MKKPATLKLFLTIFLLASTTIIVSSNFTIQTIIENNNDFEECTAVIVTGTAAKDGRAILMKNRDTSDTTNKPIYYPPTGGKHGYTMVNTYWMGINEKGLAVMNTLVSALGFGGSGMDNGALNRWIIEHCETVEEVCFELNNTDSPIGPGKRYGGTCIGVIDRFGNGAFIEISGVGAYARFIVDGYDSQANHPRYYPGYASGPSGRDQYALDIMDVTYAEKGYISWEDVAQNVSRYVRNKEKGSSSFSISGEISNTGTQAAMVAVSGDPRYDGKLNSMWGEYGNPPMVGLFIPSIAHAGQPPTILNSFWNYVWDKRSYARDASGYYLPARVREIQGYTFFAEDYTFLKYDELMTAIPDGLSDSELRTRLQEYVDDTVQVATRIYIAEPQVLIHPITHEETEFQIRTVSNSTISEFEFSATSNIEISFSVTGASGTSGFCYITIPTELSDESFQISIGEERYVISEPLHNAHESILNFTYSHPNHVTIISPEPPAGYRDYDTFIESFKSLVAAYPSLASYEVIGETVQNNQIIMFKIGNPNGGKILIDGAMHGTENLGSELLYFYAQWLLTSSEPLANQILSSSYTLVIPALNIDKYGDWRKNANGVDLNRNFATNWQYAGSTDPSSEYYRGPTPLSEPESQVLVQILQTWNPSFYINLHRGFTVLYGSYNGNTTYNSILHSKMVTLATERQVASYGYQSISGSGFAISDAASAGITSFLLELIDWQTVTLSEIKTMILPKFIPVVAVLSQEFESETIFEDCFESGNFDSWSGLTITSGGNATVSNTNPYEGSYSAKFETDAITSGIIRSCVYKNIYESTILYARAYFYIAEGLPLTDIDDRFTFIQFLGAGGNIISNLQVRRVQEEDRFTILAFTGNMQTTTAVYPQANTWYCLELFTLIHPTEGALKAYINGIEHLSLTDINTTGLGNIATVRFGLANSINIQHEVVVYSDCASISTSYIGQRTFPPWDLNQDGKTDMFDVATVAQTFGSTPESPNWNPQADLNGDGIVEMVDIAIVAKHYGEEYT